MLSVCKKLEEALNHTLNYYPDEDTYYTMVDKKICKVQNILIVPLYGVDPFVIQGFKLQATTIDADRHIYVVDINNDEVSAAFSIGDTNGEMRYLSGIEKSLLQYVRGSERRLKYTDANTVSGKSTRIAINFCKDYAIAIREYLTKEGYYTSSNDSKSSRHSNENER